MVLGLPQTTEVKRPLPKAQLFKRFDWTASQRERFDAEVSRLDFVNWISPRTVPAIAAGNEVNEIFVVEVYLKSRDFDTKVITLLAKYIPQHIVYVLRYEDEAMLAVYHTKLFTAPWQTQESVNLSLSGLNLDSVCENIVAIIGSLEVAEGHSLTEQIRIDDERNRVLRQIEALERQMRSTTQPRRQRELYAEIKKLKSNVL